MMVVVSSNHKGHTLIELLIAMALSMAIIIAVVPMASISTKAVAQTEHTQTRITQLNQAIHLLESDLKMMGAIPCADNKNLINDRLFQTPVEVRNKLNHSWVSGFAKGEWYPKPPFFTTNSNNSDYPAVSFLFTDLMSPLTINQVKNEPQKVLFISNCLFSEITRTHRSSLLEIVQPLSSLEIYPFQSVTFHLRQENDAHTLYRQYLTSTGKPRNEPIVDGISKLIIAYGEKLSDIELKFQSANDVTNWKNIIAVYIQLVIDSNPTTGISTLLITGNHES